MTKRDVAEKIFTYIRNNKFNPINIEYGNGYFIFDRGEDSVIHFSIKGLNGWKFAMWLDDVDDEEDNKKECIKIRFFCQHKLNIDKFKPSRSFFLEEIDFSDVDKNNDWNFWGIKKMLKMIQRHPFVSFSMDCKEGYYSDNSYILYYIGAKLYHTRKALKGLLKNSFIRFWHGSKVKLINRYNVVNYAKLVDRNIDGWVVSPRYEFQIHFNVISDNEDIQSEAEVKVLNKFFRKNYYDDMNLDLTREGIKGSYFYKLKD